MSTDAVVPKPRAYTPAQYGEVINVPEKTVTDLLRKKKIHGFKVGRRWVIPAWVLDELLAKPS